MNTRAMVAIVVALAMVFSWALTVSAQGRSDSPQVERKSHPHAMAEVLTDAAFHEYPFHECYPSVDDLYAWYDELAAEYPDLVTKIHIGYSWEGRDLWVLQLTSDEDTQVDYKPGFLVDGLMHAREWSTAQVASYFMWRLVTDYDSDATIHWLLNNRRIYVIPVLNPDGYVFDGDGAEVPGNYWRKNRNDTTPTDAIGVDLNRNWDHYWEWGNDDPGALIYRGEAPFSEYETQYLRDFILDTGIDSYQNLHSAGGMLLFPWGCVSDPSPHDDWYRGMAAHMTSLTSMIGDESSHYPYLRSYEAWGYPVHGGARDWVYAKTGAQSLVLEIETGSIGGYRWYPATELIMTINEDLFDALVYQARVSDVDLGDGTDLLFPPIPYVVYGTVTDQADSPVAGVTVVLQNLDTGETLSIATDTNGYYELNCGNFVEHGYSHVDTFSLSIGPVSTDFTIGDEWGVRMDLEIPMYDLTISSTAGGVVIIPGEGVSTHIEGTEVNLFAEPEEGYRFLNWTGDVATLDDANAAETFITVEGDYAITANFGAVGRCFIATAAYGTPMAEELQILREFRDGHLLKNPAGQALVGVYYRVSPPMAGFITEHPVLKPIVRAGLMPAVAMSTVVVNTSLAEKTAATGLLALLPVVAAVWATRSRGRAVRHA